MALSVIATAHADATPVVTILPPDAPITRVFDWDLSTAGDMEKSGGGGSCEHIKDLTDRPDDSGSESNHYKCNK